MPATDDVSYAPRRAARALAVGVAAQFELLLRQKDIIGEFAKTQVDLDKAARGASTIPFGDDVWTRYFVWNRALAQRRRRRRPAPILKRPKQR
jgi:hypothetical protein